MTLLTVLDRSDGDVTVSPSVDYSAAVLAAARQMRLAERPLPQLVDVPIAALVAELRLAIHREALGCDALEWALPIAKYAKPEEAGQFAKVSRAALIDGRCHIALLGQAAALLAALRPHEAAVRALIGQG